MADLKIVNYELAKLAYEKGFRDDPIGLHSGKHYYNYKGELDGDVLEEFKHRHETPNKYLSISAPSQALLQQWLREIHKIHISIDHLSLEDKYSADTYRSANEHIHNITQSLIDNGGFIYYDTYDVALKISLQKALNLIDRIDLK
jgi:hypothetical protein